MLCSDTFAAFRVSTHLMSPHMAALLPASGTAVTLGRDGTILASATLVDSIVCCTTLPLCALAAALLVCRTGKISTKAEVLQELTAQHPLPGVILEFRKLSKLLNGFLEMLLDKARQSVLLGDSWSGGIGSGGVGGSGRGGSGGRKGIASIMSVKAGTLPPGIVRIRGEFMQTNTATGRLSMEEPSLQTIPKPVVYERRLTDGSIAAAAGMLEDGVTEEADVGAGGDGVGVVVREVSNLRAAFVAPPGWLLISADYCQIELRMMAHFSGDAVLLKTLAAEDKDPFKQLAAEWLGRKVEEVSFSRISWTVYPHV